jgi:hypothetical protein
MSLKGKTIPKQQVEPINEVDILLNKGNAPKVEEAKAPEKKASTPKKDEMSRLNIYLSTKHLDKLKLKALKEHKKIKEIVEEAIISYLEK